MPFNCDGPCHGKGLEDSQLSRMEPINNGRDSLRYCVRCCPNTIRWAGIVERREDVLETPPRVYLFSNTGERDTALRIHANRPGTRKPAWITVTVEEARQE